MPNKLSVEVNELGEAKSVLVTFTPVEEVEELDGEWE